MQETSNWTSLDQWFENDQTARVKLREACDRYHEVIAEGLDLSEHIQREGGPYFSLDEVINFINHLPRTWRKR